MTTTDMVRILGIDPGLTRCGVGVVEGPSSRARLVAAACVRTAADLPIEQRLHQLYRALSEAVKVHMPTAIAVERVLFTANVRTAMATGQAAGIALLVAAEAGLDVHAYSPNEIKQTVTGDGAADKEAVAAMVTRQLHLAAPPTPVDVTDAIAVALTHVARSRLASLSARSGQAGVLVEASRQAAQAAKGGWEALLGDRIPAASSRPSTARRRS
ncbi:MAG: crossover junction endodeoxyribonuclease RuvC [Nitriliruptoraceae bacterium]